MLNIVSHICEIFNFVVENVIRAKKYFKEKKEKEIEETKKIKDYVDEKINEIYINSIAKEDQIYNAVILEKFKKVLRLKEVELYKSNPEEKQIIEMYFSDQIKNHPYYIGCMSSVYTGEKVKLSLCDNNLLNKKRYKKYATNRINYLLAHAKSKIH